MIEPLGERPSMRRRELEEVLDAAFRVMRAWGRDGRQAAHRLQRLDFAYLATYAPFLRLVTLAAGEHLARRGRQPLAELA